MSGVLLALLWIIGPAPSEQAQAMVRILCDAEAKGLRPEEYDAHLWAGRLASLETVVDRERFDAALTASVRRYLSDLLAGRVDARAARAALPRKQLPLTELLEQLAHSRDPQAALGAMESSLPMYSRVLAALQAYRRLAQLDSGDPFPAWTRTVEAGEPWEGVPRLASLLRLVGDLSPEAAVSQRYEGELVLAVRHFQWRHGLEVDGRIGRATLRALGTPLSRRVRQLELMLERMRWLPRKFEYPPLVINIPAFYLHAEPALSMKVVVGRAFDHRTPVFTASLRQLIFKPFWNVPPNIAREELLPELTGLPGLFEERGYQIVDRRGAIVTEKPPPAELLDRVRSGELLLRQKPGPRNPLGPVKFVLPNPYGVYLHGTPLRELFTRSRRDFSHGCIRVEDPLALASWVLQDQPFTDERIRAAMKGDETIPVDVTRPVTVLIVYGTAIVTDAGEVQFFDDIYGHDGALERALANRERFSAVPARASACSRR